MLQRDIFINQITKKLKKNKNIYFLSADFGAAALDELREKFPKNFIHCGISEQAMLDIATGLALEKNKVFVYAMAPFLSLRAIEQAKCGPGLMKLPICMISVGIGLGYADAGPTHYANEDFACFRAVVGSSVYTPSDNTTTRFIADEMLSKTSFSYVRLDRDQCRELNPSLTKQDYKNGFKIFGKPARNKIAILSHGKIFHNCMNIYEKNKNKYVLINLFRSKPFPKKIINIINNIERFMVVDEQSPSGGLSSCVFEGFSDSKFHPKIISKTLPEQYIFDNGGRDYLLKKYGLGEAELLKSLKKFK
jgi:transketolase